MKNGTKIAALKSKPPYGMNLGRPSHGLEATAEKSAMPNARDSAVPTISAIRYDSAFTMPLPNWESTTTSTQVMMETASVFGSAKPLSPGAPPRNSLNVNRDRETPTRKMITPDTIGANRNRSFSITRVRHSTRKISELMKMDVPAAASDPAVPAAIISASNAAEGP